MTRHTYKDAAEQKARSTYEYLIALTDAPAVLTPLRFLREREIIHFQRLAKHWILQGIICISNTISSCRRMGII
ncbi:manganese catalase family protein [Anaerotignum sp.]